MYELRFGLGSLGSYYERTHTAFLRAGMVRVVLRTRGAVPSPAGRAALRAQWYAYRVGYILLDFG